MCLLVCVFACVRELLCGYVCIWYARVRLCVSVYEVKHALVYMRDSDWTDWTRSRSESVYINKCPYQNLFPISYSSH